MDQNQDDASVQKYTYHHSIHLNATHSHITRGIQKGLSLTYLNKW